MDKENANITPVEMVENIEQERLRNLIETFWDIQKVRVANQNRTSCYVRLAMTKKLGMEMPKEKNEREKKLQCKKYGMESLKEKMAEKFGVDFTENLITAHTDGKIEYTVKDLLRLEKDLERDI